MSGNKCPECGWKFWSQVWKGDIMSGIDSKKPSYCANCGAGLEFNAGTDSKIPTQ